jgi:hypothetical protein
MDVTGRGVRGPVQVGPDPRGGGASVSSGAAGAVERFEQIQVAGFEPVDLPSGLDDLLIDLNLRAGSDSFRPN